MSKKWQAVNPRTGKWEDVQVDGKPYKTGLQDKDVEWVVLTKFEDGTSVETPLIFTNFNG